MFKSLTTFLAKHFQAILNIIIGLALVISALIVLPTAFTSFQSWLDQSRWQSWYTQASSPSGEENEFIDLQVDLNLSNRDLLNLSSFDVPASSSPTVVIPESDLSTLAYLTTIHSQGELSKLLSVLPDDADFFADLASNSLLPPVSAQSPSSEPIPPEPVYQQRTFYQPLPDPSLPTGLWLLSSKIGLNADVAITDDPEAALPQGAVLVPGYGLPGQTELPVIIASHRYGYKWWWQSAYARQNSFYYLPELEVGDILTIIYNQQTWFYEIYDTGQGTEIADYYADLILYTCEFLTGDIRLFRYARLIDPATYPERFDILVEAQTIEVLVSP